MKLKSLVKIKNVSMTSFPRARRMRKLYKERE